MRRGPVRRRGRCAVWAPAPVLAALVATAGAVNADSPGWCPCPPPVVQPSTLPESLTLEAAAGVLRVEPWELERLALRRSVPARQIGTRWRFSRAALLDWLAGIDRGAESTTAAARAATTLSAMKGRQKQPAPTEATGTAKRTGNATNGPIFDFDAPPNTRHKLTPSLSVGAKLSLVSKLEKDFDLSLEGRSDSAFVQSQGQIAFTYEPNEHFRSFLNLSLSRSLSIRGDILDREETRQTRAELKPARLELKQAYVLLKELPKGLSVKLGRQRLNDKREWLYDDVLDAAKVYFRKSNYGVEASVSRKNLFDGDFLNKDRKDLVNNYLLYGRYVLDRKSEIAAYGIFRDAQSSRKDSPLFLGLRSTGEPINDLNYWVDFAHVRDLDGPNDISGFGFDVGASYAFDLPWRPSLVLGYAFGTGDPDPSNGVDRSFRQTGLQDNSAKLNNGRVRFKYYGEVFDPELSNLSILTAGLSVRPTRKTSFDLVYHHYRQDEASDEIRDTDLDADPTGLSRDLGDEVDFIVGIREIPNLNVEATLGYFVPGAAFPDDADDAFLANLEIVYSF